MKPRLFIDGEHGTTGLQIHKRLSGREDIEVISLPAAERRNEKRRREILAECDLAMLCLPDDAARWAVSIISETGNKKCRIIDTSSAHRTEPDWAFGFAELSDKQTDIIRTSRYISNPGCYSTGAIALLRPLVDSGIIQPDHPLNINAVSGYTGGGKQLIAQMQDPVRNDRIETAFHLYSLNLKHKHVPEIMARTGLTKRPLFMPSVGRFAQGMVVCIPLHFDQLDISGLNDIRNALEVRYQECKFVSVASRDDIAQTAHLCPEDFAGRDDMKLWILGDEDTGHVNLVAQLDNLGKGASGAAIQNLDILLTA